VHRARPRGRRAPCDGLAHRPGKQLCCPVYVRRGDRPSLSTSPWLAWNRVVTRAGRKPRHGCSIQAQAAASGGIPRSAKATAVSAAQHAAAVGVRRPRVSALMAGRKQHGAGDGADRMPAAGCGKCRPTPLPTTTLVSEVVRPAAGAWQNGASSSGIHCCPTATLRVDQANEGRSTAKERLSRLSSVRAAWLAAVLKHLPS
jgi:hypothetical protein